MGHSKGLKVLAGIGIAIMIATLGAVGYGGWRAHKGIQWVREQNAKVEKLPTLEDLAGPQIPEDANAATYYHKAFDAFALTDDDEDALRGERDETLRMRRTYDLSKLRSLVKKNERALSMLERAAGMQQCRFSVDWSDPMRTEFPHIDRLRTASRLQLAKARVLAADGRPREALDAVAVCFDFGEDCHAGTPVVIAQLVSQTIYHGALRTVEDLAAEQTCSSEASSRLRGRLRELDLMKMHLRVLKGERAMQLLTLAKMPELLQERQSSAQEQMPKAAKAPVAGMGWISSAYVVAIMEEYIQLSRQPYRNARKELERLERRIDNLPIYAGFFAKIMLPVSPTGMVADRDELRAHVDLCAVALDLKAYKHANGAYPATLGALPRASEDGYAVDVFTGKRLQYERRDEAFLLYSFGKDLDDDGGKPVGRIVNEVPQWDDGDWVWQCSR